MKKITFSLNIKGEKREDTARNIMKAVTSVNETGKFQVVIQNTPVNPKSSRLLGKIRGMASVIATHFSKIKSKEISPNDVYFWNKEEFGLPILVGQDNGIKFQVLLFDQFAKRAKTDDQKKMALAKRKAMIYSIIHLKQISDEGLEEVIKNIDEYWTKKGVKFE